MPIVKTDAGREKRLKAYKGTISALPKITHVAVGDGGKEADGSLKNPDASRTSLYNEITRVTVSFEDINKFTAKFIGVLNSGTTTALVGKDINEMALVDSEGTLITIETFSLFGDGGFPKNSIVNLKTQLTVE